MATSSLLGIDRAPETAPGRDSDLLGPSDSSDSGSDLTGLTEPDDGGPSAPLISDNDIAHSATSRESVGPGLDSDASGTGERRSAAGDAGDREAADISPDRIVTDPNRSDLRDATDDDTAFESDADVEEARAVLLAAQTPDDEDDDEEIEDEDADPVGAPEDPRRALDGDDEGDDSVLLPRG